MLKPIGMSQFVDGFLACPGQEQGLIFPPPVEALPQARQGQHGATSGRIGEAKDKIQLWHEEIKIHHAQNTSIPASRNPIKNGICGILAALRNEGMFGHGERRTSGTSAPKRGLDLLA